MTVYGPYNAVVRDWHDGDTAHVDVDLGFGMVASSYDLHGKSNLKCRIFGIQAAELNTPDGSGLTSKEYAEKICPPGTFVIAVSHKWDNYGGRWDGTITLPDGTDFATQMIASGYAIPYKS